jgi:hypothetical protein
MAYSSKAVVPDYLIALKTTHKPNRYPQVRMLRRAQKFPRVGNMTWTAHRDVCP